MHVGIICDHSDPRRGGCERYLAALTLRLRAHGHGVTVCARTGPYARPVHIYPAAFRPAYYQRSFLPTLHEAGADRVLTTVPVPGCDFYQPHHGILAASIPAHLDPLPWGVRHVRRWNPWRVAHFGVLRTFEARAAAPPTRVLALSPRIVDDLQRFRPGCDVTLLRLGVDLERFHPDGAPRGDPMLLFVAHNFRLKGLHTALRTLDRLPRARLVVVGRDRPVAHPRAEYRRDADLPALFREAHAVVHPTWYDTASLVVLEALASGTPVVTTVRDGNADLAEAGGGRVLPDPGDDRALAGAVEEVLASSDAGRARGVAERFEEGAMLDLAVETLACGSAS